MPFDLFTDVLIVAKCNVNVKKSCWVGLHSTY